MHGSSAFPQPEFILLTLLLKMGVIAALASVMARSKTFENLLFVERKDFKEKMILVFLLGIPLGVGEGARLLLNYAAADVSLEGSFLIGLLGGYVTGGVTGGVLGLLPLFRKEWLSPLMLAIAGLLGGLLRALCKNKEDLWHFSPFFDLNIYRSLRNALTFRNVDWQLILLASTVGIEALRLFLVRLHRSSIWLYSQNSSTPWIVFCILISTPMAIGIALKVWNSRRVEVKLEEQERLVMQARLDALKNQINPHFLFNTLNSIASLIRTHPEDARGMVYKLSNLLRKLLKTRNNFVTLKEELDSIDDYLDIEVTRFGPEKLRVVKSIDPATLDQTVPSMILQPIIENSIKHGISPKIDGGTVQIRAYRNDGHLIIQVSDDGVGMALNHPQSERFGGIGIANVNERLRVVYGDDFQLQLQSEPGKGTVTQIRIPELEAVPSRK
ncbi:MAG: histidine kinase [Acidobacteriia bacterium]|nr:histidine kinase [Terriglobia bacterium]